MTVTLRGFRQQTLDAVKIKPNATTDVGDVLLDSNPLDNGEIPILTVCEALADLVRYDGEAIIVGQYSASNEGSWMSADCGMKPVIAGWFWQTSMNLDYRAENASAKTSVETPPQLLDSFRWNREASQKKLDELKQTTPLRPGNEWMAIYGRLETRTYREGKPFRGEPQWLLGYGHLSGARALLVADDRAFLRLEQRASALMQASFSRP
jgi:hypothetical protein